MVKKKTLIVALVIISLVSIVSISYTVYGLGPPPDFEWEVSEPFLPKGFFSLDENLSGGNIINEFTLLNGTSASFNLLISPKLSVSEFPLNLNLFVNVKDTEDVVTILSQNPVTLESEDDRHNVTVILAVRGTANEGTYDLRIGRTLGISASESKPLFINLIILNGKAVTTTITKIKTSYSVIRPDIIRITQTKTIEGPFPVIWEDDEENPYQSTNTTEPIRYLWAIEAIIISILVAALIIIRKKNSTILVEDK